MDDYHDTKQRMNVEFIAKLAINNANSILKNYEKNSIHNHKTWEMSLKNSFMFVV